MVSNLNQASAQSEVYVFQNEDLLRTVRAV